MARLIRQSTLTCVSPFGEAMPARLGRSVTGSISASVTCSAVQCSEQAERNSSLMRRSAQQQSTGCHVLIGCRSGLLWVEQGTGLQVCHQLNIACRAPAVQ
jgi:hypothetical protein